MKPRITGAVAVKGGLGTKYEAQIDPKALPHIMSILTKIYADPILAIVREYITNARDAQVEAGCNEPLHIQAPGALNQNFVVTDQGVGMSHDDLVNGFRYYGSSTKRHSDDYVGMIGIGSKSALALEGLEQFTIRTVKNGELCILAVSRNDKGTVEIDISDPVPTDESNGTTVQISIPRDKIQSFNEKLSNFLFYWHPSEYIVDGIEVPERTIIETKEVDGLVCSSSFDDAALGYAGYAYNQRGDYARNKTPIIVKMGTATYPLSSEIVDSNLLNTFASLAYRCMKFSPNIEVPNYGGRIRNNTKSYSVVIEAPIGSMDLTPNREQIQDSKESKRFSERAAEIAIEIAAEYCVEKIRRLPKIQKLIFVNGGNNYGLSSAALKAITDIDPDIFKLDDNSTIDQVISKVRALDARNQAGITIGVTALPAKQRGVNNGQDPLDRFRHWRSTVSYPSRLSDTLEGAGASELAGVIFNSGALMRIVRVYPENLQVDEDKFKEFLKFIKVNERGNYLILSDKVSKIEGVKELFSDIRSFDASGLWWRPSKNKQTSKTEIKNDKAGYLAKYEPGPHLVCEIDLLRSTSKELEVDLARDSKYHAKLSMKSLREFLDEQNTPVIWSDKWYASSYQYYRLNRVFLTMNNRFLLSTASTVANIDHPNLLKASEAHTQAMRLVRKRKDLLLKSAICEDKDFHKLVSGTLLRNLLRKYKNLDIFQDEDLDWLTDLVVFKNSTYESCHMMAFRGDYPKVPKKVEQRLKRVEKKLREDYPLLFEDVDSMITFYIEKTRNTK